MFNCTHSIYGVDTVFGSSTYVAQLWMQRRGYRIYRRDWLIGTCTYRLQQQESVHLYMYAPISGY